MGQSKKSGWDKYGGWVVAGAVVLILVGISNANANSPTKVPPRNYSYVGTYRPPVTTYYSPPPVTTYNPGYYSQPPTVYQPTTGYGGYQSTGGYENPAPGNDGTVDCPP